MFAVLQGTAEPRLGITALHVSFTRKTNWRSVGTFQKALLYWKSGSIAEKSAFTCCADGIKLMNRIYRNCMVLWPCHKTEICVWDKFWIFFLSFVLQVSRWNCDTISWYSECTCQRSVKCHYRINIYGKLQGTGVESPCVKPPFHDCRIWQMRLQLCLVHGPRYIIIILSLRLAYLAIIRTLVYVRNLRLTERRCWILRPSGMWRRWPGGFWHISKFLTLFI